MSFAGETAAFRHLQKLLGPGTTYLIDTYDTVDWLLTHMAPEETLMLDDGAGLAAVDRYTVERRRAGALPVLHYRAKPEKGQGSGS